MRDLSLHVLDILQNSIQAEASLIQTLIAVETESDTLNITISDNGKGIPPELLSIIDDPFVTSRKTRDVGMGISLFKLAAESCEGTFHIQSEPDKGTVIHAAFKRIHIDRKPLGSMGDTFSMLISSHPTIDFTLSLRSPLGEFVLDTREVKESLGDDALLSTPAVSQWIQDYIEENILHLFSDFLIELKP